mgnify:FL=1
MSTANGPVSLTVEGTPKLSDIEGPELPTVNRLENSVITSAAYPTDNVHSGLSRGELPKSVYDGNYNTGWIASGYWNSRAFTFNFDKEYEMNYLIYVPDLRNDPEKSGKRYRDYFDSFNMWINGERVTNVSFEKGKDNTYFIVKFPKSTVKSLTVEASQWAGAGNLSLTEVAFYEYGDLDDRIQDLFANDSHTALAEGVDQDKIDALRARAKDADAYYVNLRFCSTSWTTHSSCSKRRTAS